MNCQRMLELHVYENKCYEFRIHWKSSKTDEILVLQPEFLEPPAYIYRTKVELGAE